MKPSTRLFLMNTLSEVQIISLRLLVLMRSTDQSEDITTENKKKIHLLQCSTTFTFEILPPEYKNSATNSDCTNQNLNEIIKKVELQYQINKSTIDQNKILTSKFESELNKNKQIQNILKMYPFLSHLFQQLLTFQSINCHGKRYNDELLKEFCILLSYSGEFWYNFIQKSIGLPNIRTIYRWKQKNAHLDIERMLQGEQGLEWINILNKLWNNQIIGTRIVVAIDAASLSPNFRFHITTGNKKMTIGLIKEVEVDQGKSLLESVDENNNSLCKYAFVVMLLPICDSLPAIPFRVEWSIKGNATDHEELWLHGIIAKLMDYGIIVEGISSDGDLQWAGYALLFGDEFVKFIKENFYNSFNELFTLKLENLTNRLHVLKWLHDILHIAKCDRYHKLIPKKKQLIPFIECESNCYEFQKIALDLNVASYLIDNDRSRKMDDYLPIRLFKKEIFFKALDNGNYTFSISMLPIICLLDVYFCEELSRSERLDLCNLAFGLTSIYFILSRNHGETITTSKCNRKDAVFVTSFQDDECAKMMHLSASLASIIQRQESIKLGRLSTHILEHLFGFIRKICEGNDEKYSFLSALIRYVSITTLKKRLKKFNLIPSSKSRKSDSGVTLPACHFMNISKHPIIFYLKAAIVIYEKASTVTIENEIISNIKKVEIPQLDSCDTLKEIISLFPIRKGMKKVKDDVSLKKMHLISTGGLCNDARNKQQQQIEQISKYFT